MADGGCQMVVLAVVNIAAVVLRSPSSVVNNVFDCGGAPSSSDCGCHCHGLVISLPPLSLRGGTPLDPDGDGNDDEDDDDRSRQDHAMGIWVLCRGTSTITKTNCGGFCRWG